MADVVYLCTNPSCTNTTPAGGLCLVCAQYEPRQHSARPPHVKAPRVINVEVWPAASPPPAPAPAPAVPIQIPRTPDEAYAMADRLVAETLGPDAAALARRFGIDARAMSEFARSVGRAAFRTRRLPRRPR